MPYYDYEDIITWAKMSQALASIGGAKKRATTGSNVEKDLDVKLYMARKSLEWLYNQDPDDENLYELANYVLALCGIYLFPAQAASGSGGSVAPPTGGQLTQNPLTITGADFSSSNTWSGANSYGQTMSVYMRKTIFYNPASRWLTEGVDYNVSGVGFQLLTGVGEPFQGFDATAGNINDQFIIFISL